MTAIESQQREGLVKWVPHILTKEGMRDFSWTLGNLQEQILMAGLCLSLPDYSSMESVEFESL